MSNKFLKKEYLIPLAIIIGTVIIGLSIYLGVTAEYRAKKAICEEQWAEMKDDTIRKGLHSWLGFAGEVF